MVSYFWVPTPSAVTLESLVRRSREHHNVSVGNDGQTYEFVWVRRPRWELVADPKGWVWVRSYTEDGALVEQGLQRIFMVLGERPVLGNMFPRMI